MSVRNIIKQTFLLSSFIFFTTSSQLFANASAREELRNQYDYHCNTPSDVWEHLPHLRKLAAQGSSVVEIGLRDIISTWGILQGLSESAYTPKQYLGIDMSQPPIDRLNLARRLAEGNGIEFYFCKENDMNILIPETDLLFIDGLHTYCHLTYELEKFADSVNNYIALHDTSAPWGDQDDSEYHGDYSEYPSFIDRTKRGIWTAVEDFLARHPEWKLKSRDHNCYGFTVLKRKKLLSEEN